MSETPCTRTDPTEVTLAAAYHAGATDMLNIALGQLALEERHAVPLDRARILAALHTARRRIASNPTPAPWSN